MVIVFFIRVYYGVRWLCKGRTRSLFQPYYRWSVTFYWSYILGMAIQLLNLKWKTLPTYVKIDIAYSDMNNLLAFIELVWLEFYIRYLDEIHFARNAL